jgi:hypothetical protein
MVQVHIAKVWARYAIIALEMSGVDLIRTDGHFLFASARCVCISSAISRTR